MHDCSQFGATIYRRCAFERARIMPPWRLDAHAHRLGRELFVICAEPLARVLDEVLNHQGDILAPLAQRG
jgi:hypothetical protein